MSFVQRITFPAPLDYVTPPFPSLYWPTPVRGPQAYYLYHPSDIWRFTLYWTFIFYGTVHLATSGYAVAIQLFDWAQDSKGRVRGFIGIWIVPAIYLFIAGIEALIAGSVVGALLGAVYNAGYFRMSTWIPFVWALVNTLVLILSSFAIQGGL
ncbi:hypothetical protein M501DRAFT_1018572 [Patellaria atrata CBS 101060]|uniref:Integral membrane protein n=1 Tax=Patellaria atrata CBS 101060 TaxID=1346257 RepID=A0A9P4S5U8_9PEZI|nr:hypothetical protein M501DRAFT_1018572 [Patellaria atrata CBS 101060]